MPRDASPRAYDALDVAVTLLKKREGIDKTLKLARYAALFALGEAKARARPSAESSEFVRATTALERSIGDARRAYRLGKFLGNVRDFRDEVRENEGAGKRGRARWLTAAAACAALEGAYYFIEQGVWLSKAGVAMRRRSTLERLVRWSARAEVASYAFSIACSREDWLEADAAARAARVRLRDVETAKASALERGDDEDVVISLTADVNEAEKAKRKAVLAICQDVADGVLSFEDAVDVAGFEIPNERLVNLLGLLAAALDFHGKLDDAIESLDESSR